MAVGQFSLNGKIAVITGGGSGISLAFACLAASRGARIIIADLRLTAVAEEFISSSNGVIFAKCDVTRWDELRSLSKLSEEKFGNIPDVYVAGAGVFEPPWSNFWTDSEDERYGELDINTSHPIQLSRIAIRALLSKNKPGVVLILSSMGGLHGSYPAPLYTASKHALVGFTKSMGQADADEGVKIVCICPSFVTTPLWLNSPSQMDQYSFSSAFAQTASAVAETIALLIEDPDEKYPGGTIMQVSLGGTEVVETRQVWEGAPVPEDVLREAVIKSFGPVREILKKERKGEF